jgi:hypothetical protein
MTIHQHHKYPHSNPVHVNLCNLVCKLQCLSAPSLQAVTITAPNILVIIFDKYCLNPHCTMHFTETKPQPIPHHLHHEISTQIANRRGSKVWLSTFNALMSHFHHLRLGQFPRRIPVLLRADPSTRLLAVSDLLDSAVLDLQRRHRAGQDIRWLWTPLASRRWRSHARIRADDDLHLHRILQYRREN